jgi:hypothetical protein
MVNTAQIEAYKQALIQQQEDFKKKLAELDELKEKLLQEALAEILEFLDIPKESEDFVVSIPQCQQVHAGHSFTILLEYKKLGAIQVSTDKTLKSTSDEFSLEWNKKLEYVYIESLCFCTPEKAQNKLIQLLAEKSLRYEKSNGND